MLYRSLTFKQFYKMTMDTIETTAAVLLIVGEVLRDCAVTEVVPELIAAARAA